MSTSVEIARFVLVALFAIAASSKLIDRGRWRETLTQLGISARFVSVLVWAVPIAELSVAVALAVSYTSRWGAVAAATMLGAFSVVIWMAVARGRTPDCNCFGRLGSSRLSWGMGARNLLLASIAGLVAWSPDTRPSTLAVVAILAAILIAAQCWFSLLLLRRYGRTLARLEELEARTPTALAGLPVGAEAPNFFLDGISGQRVGITSIGGPARSTLLAFVDPNCAPCEALIPQLAAWHRDRPDLAVALISAGDPDEHRARLASHDFSAVLLQRDREVAEAYGTPGTPAAVLIDPRGRIAAPVALGADSIHRLVTGSPSDETAEAPELRPALGARAAAAAGVSTALIGASQAFGQDGDPGIDEIRAKLAAATPDFVADFDALQKGLTRFLASKSKHGAPSSSRKALAAQRTHSLNLRSQLATVTAESAESQAVRDTLLNSLGYHVEALDEFDHLLGLRSKQQIKRSQKKAFKLLQLSRTAGYYANVGLGCTGKGC